MTALSPSRDLTLPSLLSAGFADPSRPVLVGGGAPLTYGVLDDRAARMAQVMVDAGVRAGDRLAYQVDKSPTVLALHLAALKVGSIQLPLNPAYTDGEVAALLADAEVSLLVRDPGRATLSGGWETLTLDGSGLAGTLAEAVASSGPLSEVPQLTPEDGAALLYTSGTTGRPKGALLSHGNLVHNARSLVSAWGFERDDVLVHLLPMFHTHGLFVATHCVLAAGASMVFLPRFDVTDVVDALDVATVVMGVPTHYARLLEDPGFDSESTRNVRLFVSGSAPMPAAMHEEFTARTGQVILERYGMTETSMLTSNPLRGPRRPGTVGPPLPEVEVRVVDDHDRSLSPGVVGDVQVRGPNVFAGYWCRPDLTASEFAPGGWFRTGDLGLLDDDGYLELVGRAKDLVISGGLNVHPKEVEAAIDAVDGVVESAVIGLPDSDLGEAVTAVVVREVGCALDATTLRTSVRDRLAGFKVPRRVVFVEHLPRNAMGKVEKSRLRAELSDVGP